MSEARLVRVIPWDGAITAYDAYFHVWAGTSERAYAIVETLDGAVVHLDSRDGLKFVPRPFPPADAPEPQEQL